MEAIEQFFTDYEKTAWAFFSTVAFLWAAIKIALTAYKYISNRANLNQRHEFQAGYFDIQEARHDKMLGIYIELKSDFIALENKSLKADIKRLEGKSE